MHSQRAIISWQSEIAGGTVRLLATRAAPVITEPQRDSMTAVMSAL